MGNIGQSLFGGNKSTSTGTSTSSNKAYDFLKGAFGGQVEQGSQANSMVANLLGLGDDAAGDAALERYNKSSGMDFLLDSGSRAITGNMASKGLLNSGATLKGLTTFGQGLASTQFGSYLDKLMGLADGSYKAGGIIGNAGQVSQSQSSSKGNSKPGIGGFLGQVGAGIAASDPRLKENVYEVGTLPNGLGIYSFNYIGDPKSLTLGVMADEVAEFAPEALGPEVDGYMTVDYDKLEGWVN
jgi:hypothetical protein